MRLKDIQLTDLEVIRPIGRGTFGTVYTAKHIDPTYVKGQIAVKCMDKATVVGMQQEFCIMREITANRSFHHHFIAEFYGTCWSPRKIFLLMEHVDGDELWSYLYGNGDDKPLKYTPCKPLLILIVYLEIAESYNIFTIKFNCIVYIKFVSQLLMVVFQ